MTETSSVDVQQTDRHVGLKLQIQGNVENKDLGLHWPLGVLNLTEMNKISERDWQERKAEAKDQELASFRCKLPK